jgi:hypothetical protein
MYTALLAAAAVAPLLLLLRAPLLSGTARSGVTRAL